MKSKINVFLLGILIFLLGGVAGAISHYLYRQYLRKTPNFMQIMAKELKLDPDQEKRIKVILNETRDRVKELNQKFAPQYEAINQNYMPQHEILRKESDQKMKNILRSDQIPLFEEFLRKRFKPPQIKNISSKDKGSKQESGSN